MQKRKSRSANVKAPKDRTQKKRTSLSFKAKISRSGITRIDQKMAGTAKETAMRRYAPGLKALQEVRHYQQMDTLLCRKLPFQRMVRSLTDRVIDENTYLEQKIKFTGAAMNLLQILTEDQIINYLEDAKLCSTHGKRVTLQKRDLLLAARIRDQIEYDQFEF